MDGCHVEGMAQEEGDVFIRTEVSRLQVDLSAAEPEDYVLKLTVTDMNTGQRAKREAKFTLVE
jgi:hypothetical protein